MQRNVAAVLIDSLCDVQVIDDLSPVGMFISYTTTQRLLQLVANHSETKLVKAVQARGWLGLIM